MATVTLEAVAHARSGDKGTASNVGLVARSPGAWTWLRATVTAEFVRTALAGFVEGEVERFEVPGIMALNFILHDSLGGGGSASLLTDAQGKTHAQALLRCPVDVPDEVLSSV